MPAQVRGRIRRLNFAGEACIHNILKGNVAKAVPAINPLLSFTAIDFETASNKRNSVCQVGLVKVVNGVIIDEYCGLIQPPDNFINQEFSARIHGIYPDHTANAPTFAESYPHWRHYIEGQSLVAHNISFDSSCLKACLKSFLGREAYMAYAMNMREEFCTMKIWRGAFENAQLATCCAQLDINLAHHHNALADARACAELFMEAIRNGRTLY